MTTAVSEHSSLVAKRQELTTTYNKISNNASNMDALTSSKNNIEMSSQKTTLRKSNNESDKSTDCVICLDAAANVAILPCGHLVSPSVFVKSLSYTSR